MTTSADSDPTADAERAGPRQGIQSVELAMTVIEALESGLGPMSLTQIANASGMAASKVHRYLVSLGRAGLVVQSHRSGLYDFGPAMRRLGIESLRRMDEVGVASEHLPDLRDRTGHAVNLAVWGDHGPVLVRWDYGAHALPITIRVGATMPLLTSAIGRVYLAHLPATMTTSIVETELETLGTNAPSKSDVARLRATVLEQGVATISGEVIPGVMSVAAPVFPAGQSIPLAVAVALPSSLGDTATVAEVTLELLRTTKAISEDYGSVGGAAGGPIA
ncbi:transcriptional regulator, IclR family protein [Rhodococcus jostii RHA1]|uniref:Transcriptional regulator, IclR family protein n=2 Tax=Rhodococcus TaxID=1827 RepID=Q0SFL4_RHOJR|nr:MULTISPECIES: IclR family transcriptional regulator [Rhodococcus]ABG93672.1 transcriptional regulator, IclR family protein [Rhodococcus jostii RHA1]